MKYITFLLLSLTLHAADNWSDVDQTKWTDGYDRDEHYDGPIPGVMSMNIHEFNEYMEQEKIINSIDDTMKKLDIE